MATGAAMMNAARISGPAFFMERGLSTGQQSPRFETRAFRPVPVRLPRSEAKHRAAARRNIIRAEANSRDASRPGSEGPGEIKRTVKKEVGVSTGKAQPGSSDVSSSQAHAQAADGLHHEDPNSFAARQLNSKFSTDSVSSSTKQWQAATDAGIPTSFDKLGNNRSDMEAKKQHEVSDAVSGTFSYAQVAENLRQEKEKPKAGPIRSEVLERAAPKEKERAAPKQQNDGRQQSAERPFKESRQDGELNLESPQKRSFNFKSLAAIVTVLFIAFALAPVWSPIVGKVLTPFFQLVGVAVAVKFFITDFLRADKRKELYKKGEKLEDDIKG